MVLTGVVRNSFFFLSTSFRHLNIKNPLHTPINRLRLSIPSGCPSTLITPKQQQQQQQQRQHLSRSFLSAAAGRSLCTFAAEVAAPLRPASRFDSHSSSSSSSSSNSSNCSSSSSQLLSDRKRKILNGTEYIRRKTGYRGRIRRGRQAPC